jgi:hypothetical protein
MKVNISLICKLVLVLGLGTLGQPRPANAAASPAPAPAPAGATNSPGSSLLMEIPTSAFNIPTSPKEGRNPFFPHSTFGKPTPSKAIENPVDATAFALNGITSPPKRTAMINGRTFEPGEEGEVRLIGGGKELIRCEEIRADSALIVIRGVRKELRFRSGF